MRSKAHLRGHPIHPALIPFPLAFLFGAFGLDVTGVIAGNADLWRAGGLLSILGIVTALAAAVPGFIDYFYAVPPRSSGKARATRHMLCNLGAVVLFVAAALLRGGISNQPGAALLLIELVAVGLLTVGGWMGGVLVSRNQISVDHRYAGAGKWAEARVSGKPGEWSWVARKDDLQVDQIKLLHTANGRIALARAEDGWVAFDDHCSHRGASLADGAMICGTVQCPWHGSQFDVKSGAVRAGPAEDGIKTYPVEEREDGIYLKID